MAQRAPGVRGLHQPRGRQLEHPGVHMCTEAVLFYMDTAQVFSGVHLYVHTASSIQVTMAPTLSLSLLLVSLLLVSLLLVCIQHRASK